MIDLLNQAMQVKTDGLFLCVLGSSGAGKSHLIGTYPGKTLLIYGSGESHGPSSAIKSNKGLIAVAWDRELVNGKVQDIPVNKVLGRINDLLNPEMLKKNGVKCVALDSLTNLCLDIKKMDSFKQRCTTAQGKPNPFKETEALIELNSLIIRKLQELVDYHDIDVITTLDLQIQSVAEDGTILESKPGLPTFGVGKALIQQFSDILVLRRVSANKSVFQNKGRVSSKSKDAEQNLIKYVEYHPRLRGVSELPEEIEATIPSILGLKK